MNTLFKRLWANEEGQDLIEYTLLLAFVLLASVTLMTKAGASTSNIWTAASTTLSNAAAKAS